MTGAGLSRFLQGVAMVFPVVHPLIRYGGGILWVLLVLGGMVRCWWVWRHGEGLPVLSPGERLVLGALVAIPLMMSLSLVNADDWRLVGQKWEKLLQVLVFPLAYWWVRETRVDLGRGYFWGVVAASVVMVGVGGWQMVQGAPWAHGAYYRILYGDLALYFLLLMVVADLVWLRGRVRWLVWAAMACAFVAVVLSGTRGAWLAGLVFMPWVLWCYRRVLSPRRWALLGLGSILAVGLVVAVPGPIQDRLLSGIQELDHLGERPGSWGTRYHLWRLSVAVWREHPWLGTGLGDFHSELGAVVAAERIPVSPHYDHAHSLYFDALATTGLVGLMALLMGFFVVPALYFHRHWRMARGDPYWRFLALAGLVGVVAFALFGFTEGWLSRMHFTRAYLMHLLVFVSTLAQYGSGVEQDDAEAP